MIQQYHIGLVVSRMGLTDRQHAWMMTELKHRANLLTTKLGDASSEVMVYVPGFPAPRSDTYHGVPPGIWNRPLPAQCKMTVTPTPGNLKTSSAELMQKMLMMDEVWCMPTYGQIHALSRGRPAVIYRTALREGVRGNRFKWIVPWVETDQPAEKQKKGKKNAKPTCFRT
jgi:hypothetical protein